MASAAKPAKAKSPPTKDPAAAAALLVTKTRPAQKRAEKKDILDKDGKLSSASAATSLKHAKPTDLPSFPVVGIANPESSAGAAASLAAANPKTIEHWKPDKLPAANKAAYLAKDYRADPLWQPEQSAAGSKAALLAHRKGGDVDIWRAEASIEGNSAAGQAMRKKGLGPDIYSGVDDEEAGRAKTAAHGAMSSGRYTKPFPPVPQFDYSYPDAVNSATNALSAASKAAQPPKPRKVVSVPTDLPGLSAQDARRIHDAAVTNLSRDMYTSNPPVAPEVEERNYQAGLNAAAVSMAKAMYATQQRLEDSSRKAATAAAGRKSTSTAPEPNVQTQAQQYLHLQDAARKLAAERLSKMQDSGAAYRSYYGQDSPKRGFSLRARRSRRGSSGDLSDMTDPERAKKIRSQMTSLQSGLQQVDEKKRQTDREALLAAAQRNVRQSMYGMDEKVFAETGKASPAMQAEWEKKARERAKEKSAARLENYGKVDIGGGKYLDQSEIDAIAAARVQPTLDQISEKAAADRARDEALRQQAEQRKADAEEKQRQDKERNKETDREWRKMKEDEKAEKKRRKEEEKARKEEEKKQQKEKVEEAQWQQVREKERAKEEKAAEKKADEERKRAERERTEKLAAEYEAIKAEEKRKSKEAKQKDKEDQQDQKEAEKILASTWKEIEEEDKAAAKEREQAEREAAKAREKEEKEAEEEREEKDDAAQKIHEIAEQVRSQARTQALMEYLQEEQAKVAREKQAEAEAEAQKKERIKGEQEHAKEEELEKIDREIAENKERKEQEREHERELREEQREQQRERDEEQKEYEARARAEELEKVDREIAASKEQKEHEQQQQEHKKVQQEEAEAWWKKEGQQKEVEEAESKDKVAPIEPRKESSEDEHAAPQRRMSAAEELHEYEREKAEAGITAGTAAGVAEALEAQKSRPEQTRKSRLIKRSAKDESTPASDKRESSVEHSSIKKRLSVLSKKDDKAKEDKSRSEKLEKKSKDESKGKDKDKDKRRSKGFGLGAVAAAIGVTGEKEDKKDKAEKAKEQVPSEHDSEASTPLSSENEDEGDASDSKAEAAGRGIPDAREKDFGQHETPVEQRVAIPADARPQTPQEAKKEAAEKRERQHEPVKRKSDERIDQADSGVTTTIVGGTDATESKEPKDSRDSKETKERKSIDGRDRKIVITGKAKEKEAELKKEKEDNKRDSWFRRLSKRSSKPNVDKAETSKTESAIAEKPESDTDGSRKVTKSDTEKERKPHKLQKPQDRTATPDPNDGKHIIEPITGLPVDITKSHPGHGTDGIPRIQPAEETSRDADADVSGAVAGAGAGVSASHSQREESPPHATATTSTGVPEGRTTPPPQSTSTALTSNSLTSASPGRPNISAPISKHAIQNSTGFTAESPVQPRPALEPGIPPSGNLAAHHEGSATGSARAVALARADGGSTVSSTRRPEGSVTDDSDAEDTKRRANLLAQEHGATLGASDDDGRRGRERELPHRPFDRSQRQMRSWSPDSSSDEDDKSKGRSEKDIKDADLDRDIAQTDLSGDVAKADRQARTGFRRSLGKLMGKLDSIDPTKSNTKGTEGTRLSADSAGSEGDQFQEARDRLDSIDTSAQLSPPAPIRDEVGRGTPSPARSTRFREEL